jgi:hypothetical protein
VSLGKWAEFQRHLAAKGRLSAERQQRLDRLHGWSWNLRDSKWERAFGLLLLYVEHNGNARVPKKFVIDGYPLGAWVDDQRVRHGKGILDNDRKDRLGVLPGWSWEPTTDRWEEGFRHLQEFVKRHGHAMVKRRELIEGFLLGRWCSKQRTRNAKGLLEERRWSRLDALPGWSWDVHADRWEEGYSHLLLFVDQHGRSRVAQAEMLDGYPLGTWVAKQRSDHAKGVLGRDRAERLKALPTWSWTPQRISGRTRTNASLITSTADLLVNDRLLCLHRPTRRREHWPGGPRPCVQTGSRPACALRRAGPPSAGAKGREVDHRHAEEQAVAALRPPPTLAC